MCTQLLEARSISKSDIGDSDPSFFRLLLCCLSENNGKFPSWEEARKEWEVVGLVNQDILDEKGIDYCSCGKEELNAQYIVRNKRTDQYLFPVGSVCILNLNRTENLPNNMSLTPEFYNYLKSKMNLVDCIKQNKDPRKIRFFDSKSVNNNILSRKVLNELWNLGCYDNPNRIKKLETNFNKRMKQLFNKLGSEEITTLDSYLNSFQEIKELEDIEDKIAERFIQVYNKGLKTSEFGDKVKQGKKDLTLEDIDFANIVFCEIIYPYVKDLIDIHENKKINLIYLSKKEINNVKKIVSNKLIDLGITPSSLFI